MNVRVYLVDDSAAFLQYSSRFLASVDYIRLVGSATCGSRALAEIPTVKPDLVLLDIAMPGMSGFDVLREIKKCPNAPKVVILTFYNDIEYRKIAESLGVNGYVVKSELGTELLPLIENLFAKPTEAALA